MTNIPTIAFATYGEIVRRPLYYVLLFSFALGIFLSKMLTLFSFYTEINMVREMGIATLTFWGFIIIVVTCGIVVTQELEDRTAVTLLSKPIRRTDFLLGKFLGLWLSIIPGLFVLAGILFLTLWMMAAPHLPLSDWDVAQGLKAGRGPFRTTWIAIWDHFILPQGGIVVEGAFLSTLQAGILTALAVCFSAFFSNVVAVGTLTLVFILGNISSYMVASVERLKVGPLSALAHGFSLAAPNLGYFNLQTYFSEGKIISFRYLAMSSVYSALLVSAVFIVACSLFQKREVR
jgi:ABC-type transport system involved in multi-copper enzyme maturation permease subunit